jgi:nitrate/nitrite transporter NarK
MRVHHLEVMPMKARHVILFSLLLPAASLGQSAQPITPQTVEICSNAAGCIALINSLGAIGAFIGPTLLGYLKDRTGTHQEAFLLLSAFALVGAVILFGLRAAPEVAHPVATASMSSG